MSKATARQTVYRFDRFVLDLGRGTLLQDEKAIPLRPKSFEVLRYLVEHHGLLATKDEIIRAIWGHQYVSEGSLTQCIIDVRRALGDQQQALVRTIPCRGYILDVPVEALETDGQESASDEFAEPTAASSWAKRLAKKRQAWIVVGLIALLTAVAASVLWRDEGEAPLTRFADTKVAALPNSIAVLPFLDLSTNADQAWFVDGISEEILNLLAQSPDLHVIARTSSFSFRDQNLDIPSIARQLGVTYVLEGSVRKEGRDVRITAQLVTADRGGHLWSQTYNREFENILELQSEIAEAVASALQVQIVEKRPAGKVNPGAYEAFLQAEFFYNRRSPGDIERARDHYQQAVDRDPGFARAWVGLSGAFNLLQVTEDDGREKLVNQQFRAAQIGLELNPALAVANVRMAQAFSARDQFDLRDEFWLKAVAIDPDDPYILGVRAGSALSNLQWDKALELQRRAVAADPVSTVPRSNLASMLFSSGHYQEALNEYEKSAELNPAWLDEISPYVAQLLVQLERYQEALEVADTLAAPNRDLVLAMALSRMAQPAQAAAPLQRLESAQNPEAMVLLAQWYAWSGEPERALELLDLCTRYFLDGKGNFAELAALRVESLSGLFIELRADSRWMEWYEGLQLLGSVLRNSRADMNPMDHFIEPRSESNDG